MMARFSCYWSVVINRRNLYDQTLDLTPYNAVGPMVRGEEFAIKYK